MHYLRTCTGYSRHVNCSYALIYYISRVQIYSHVYCNNYMEVPSEISTSPFQVQYSVKVLQLLAYAISTTNDLKWPNIRVSVQGVKSLGGHFACLCRGFEFYEVKKKNLLLFFKKKMEILLHFLSFL